MRKQENTLDLSPGNIFKRIYAELCDCRDSIHLDGSSDYQRGFFEGFDLARRAIEVEQGNIVCQVTAERSRRLENSGK